MLAKLQSNVANVSNPLLYTFLETKLACSHEQAICCLYFATYETMPEVIPMYSLWRMANVQVFKSIRQKNRTEGSLAIVVSGKQTWKVVSSAGRVCAYSRHV